MKVREKTKVIKLDERLKDNICNGISSVRKQIEKILQAEQPNEELSVFLIRDLLKNAFGYQESALIPQATNYGKRADITVRYTLGDVICEVKRYDAQRSLLGKKAQDQLYCYCSYNKCEWGILTDGIRWEFYWFPPKKQEGKKFAEASFAPLPGRITDKWCQQFYIFHAKVKNHLEYAKACDVISPENVIWWLRHKEGFNALCQVIQNRQGKTKAEVKKLIPLIYECFDKILPLPEGRNNPYVPPKEKRISRNKKRKNTKMVISVMEPTQIIK